jgi:large subunit ribosomal protein L28
MSRVCQVTGKKPLVGCNVSHSNRHTKKRFEINLRAKRFWLEDEKRWITLRVTARAMRTIDKLGLSAVVADMRRRGEKV